MFKNKNHGREARRDSCCVRGVLREGLAHRLDALGAQHLVDHASFFHYNRLLQVGFEGPIGGALGERAIVPEGGGLAAVCTLSHDLPFPFLAIIPISLPFSRARHFTT